MIFGDPFYFVLQFDVVGTWNSPDDTWRNGIFSLYINGNRVFGVIDAFELRTTFGFYSNAPIGDLCINDSDWDAEALYRNAESYFTGDGGSLIDGLFDMTCTAMEDNGCYLYFIRTSLGDRLVWSTDNGVGVSEIVLASGSVCSVIESLKSCNEKGADLFPLL